MNQEAEKQSLFNLVVDEEMKYNLKETAKWARFLSIVGFVIISIMILAGLFSLVAVYADELTIGYGIAVLFSILLIAGLYFYPIITLLKFGRGVKVALLNNNQVLLNQSLRNLKNCFLYLGILAIILLCLYGVMAIVLIISAATSL